MNWKWLLSSQKASPPQESTVVIHLPFLCSLFISGDSVWSESCTDKRVHWKHGPQWNMAPGGRNLVVSCWNSSLCQHQRGYGCFWCPWYTWYSSTPARTVSTQLCSVRAPCCLSFQKKPGGEERNGLWSPADLGSDPKFLPCKLHSQRKLIIFSVLTWE